METTATRPAKYTFGVRLREAREARGYSIEQAAAAIGLTGDDARFWQRWEAGELKGGEPLLPPDEITAMQIELLLGVNWFALLFGDEREEARREIEARLKKR